MLFIREDLEKLKAMPETQSQEEIARMMEWVEELSRSGNFVSGEPLETEIRVAKADTILHSGPFVETTEGLSGYLVVNAETIDQAAELAQGCPLLGTTIKSIEVRPIQKTN